MRKHAQNATSIASRYSHDSSLINKTKKVLGTGYTNCLIMHLFAVAAVKQVDMTLRKQPYDNATFRFLKDKARRELSRWRAMHTSNILNRVNFFTPERKDAIVAGAKFFAQWWVNEHLQLLANDSTEKRWGTDSQISQSRYLSQEDLMHDGEYQHHNSPSLKRASCDGMNDVEHKAKMQLVEFKRQVPAPPPQTGVDEDCEMSDDGDEPFAPPQIQPAQSQTQPTASQAQTSSSDDEDVEMSDDSQDVPDLSSMPSLNINGNKAAAPAAFTADQGKIGFMKQMAKTSPRRSMDSGIGVRYGYEVKNTPAFPQEETQKASRAGTGPAKASTPVTPNTSTSSGNRQAEQHETINSSNKLSQPRADSMEPSSGYKDQFTSDGQSAAMGGSTQMPSCNGLTGLAAKQATVEDADESENEMNGADQGQRASVNIPQPTPADSHVERTDNGSGGVPATKYMAARVDEVSEDELEDYVDDVDEEIADAPEPVQYAAFTRNPTIPRGIDLSTVRVGLDNLTPIVAPTNSSGSRPTIPQQNAQTSGVQGFGAGASV